LKPTNTRWCLQHKNLETQRSPSKSLSVPPSLSLNPRYFLSLLLTTLPHLLLSLSTTKEREREREQEQEKEKKRNRAFVCN